MAGFDTFDMSRIIGAAEQIKGMKREASRDVLRDQYLQTQIQGAQQNQQFAQAEQQTQVDQRTARQRYLEAQAIEQAADPIAAARDFAPDLIQSFEKAHGAGSFAQLPPDVVKQLASAGKQRAAAAAGIDVTGGPELQARLAAAQASDEKNFGQQKEIVGLQHQNRLGEIAASSRVKPGNAFRPLTPEEVAQVGLPAGTSAQVDETTGKIDVLSKRDATGALNQKDMTTAKMKLNTVSLARQQLGRIRQEFEGIKGTMSAGAFGQGRIPSEGGRKFDAAVNQMRSTLTALTRVPGVGAMSDYETKLDQSKFPTRNDYESVTEQQLGDLDNMLNAIETGYKDLLGSAPQGATPQSGAQTQQQADPLGIR
jgi:hypothetical protein